ncbi:MAG: response regulator transcription factor [Lacunisphaera sp.]|nr:response regulator transcription factor [Lacunisphaera sp.]
MNTSVSIVEDNRGTREELTKLFSRAAGISFLRAYGSGEEAVAGIPKEPPQVAVVDINLPGISGIECVSQLKRLCPEMQVLMLTTYEETELIFSSLRAGANGYLLKNMPAEEIVQAVGDVRAGGAPMSLQIARKVVAHFHQSAKAPGDMGQLTPRENEILQLLAKGCLYKEIASQLGISMSTVRTHIHSVYEKLHVQSRTEAVVKFLRKN